MAYEINEAKQLVIEAGLKLIETGLIARTWGNVSARISDTQFVITPSGLPYETLTPDEIVVVNIEDSSYEGDIKPSSEKKMHSALYTLRPDVNFIIHTHQTAASAISVTRSDIHVPEEFISVIGPLIPTAEYGVSSTKTLTENVRKAAEKNPEAKAVLMAHHGAVCLGKDFTEAFEIASALEKSSEAAIAKVIGKAAGDSSKTYADLADVFLEKIVPQGNRGIQFEDLGNSVRNGDTFTLTMKDGSSYVCDVESGDAKEGIVPRAAKLHSTIYKNSGSTVTTIHHLDTPDVVALSCNQKDEVPLIDDFAMIAGSSIASVYWQGNLHLDDVAKGIKKRNAILIAGMGALCTGNSDEDAHCVELVMAKECKASLYAAFVKGSKAVGFVGRTLERLVYVKKYSKMAEDK